MPTAGQLPKARLIFVATLALLTAFCVLFLLRGRVSAAPSGNAGAVPLVSPTSTPVCPNQWHVISSPNAQNANSSLYSIAVVADNDVWAVGSSSNPSITLTLIEHWDGVSWSIVPSPNPDATYNVLNGVAAVSANDVWAVGQCCQNTVQRTLIEHWDGSAWSVVPSPNPGQDSARLNGVSAVSANDVWAVGVGPGTISELIEHWDGTTWSIVPPESPYARVLQGVAAVTRNDVWAVGYGFACPPRVCGFRTRIEHWDGYIWSGVPSPNVGIVDNHLYGVAAISSTDVWSVGDAGGTLTEHWNGSAWSVIPSPNIGPNDVLNGVAAVSANDVWAVGHTNVNGADRTLIEHWNGSTWSVAPSPNVGTGANTLSGVVAGGYAVWSVGNFCCPNYTLVEQYNRCIPATSTPTVTPTPQPPPCPGERFTDVCPTDYFYTATLALADDGILSGYSTVPPCPNSQWVPCFRPYNSSTRGQISKVVTLSASFNEPVTGQTFEDVPPGSTFYTYTERMADRGIISGYPCGGAGEPCMPPGNRPYFRTNNNVTRGQVSKMVSLAFGWTDPPVGQDFEDIPPASTFYTYTFQLYSRSIINGYQCGGPGEPCVPPGNRPYFRPNNNVKRGQTAKIVQLARTQPTCSSQWHTLSSPNPSNTNSNLTGIAVVADNDIWAVGSSSSPSATLTLIEHWDGMSWTIVPSPNPSARNNALNAVVAVATNDVWAVGWYIDVNVPDRILIEHWNGSNWSVVPGANPGSGSSGLYGVTALATDDVWAVGYGGARGELVEHWDGSTWSVVPSPETTWVGALTGVAAIKSNDIWAVGYTQYCLIHMCHFFTLVEHWDGSTWNVVASPNPNPDWSLLHDVAVVSANDVWAVGNAGQTLVEHWDGSAWSVVPSPNPGTNAGLGGVAVVSANDVWAIGSGNDQTLVEHWDGNTWSVVSSPNGDTGANTLSGVAVVEANDVWAVGNSCCPNRTLVERYNPCPPATSTPTATPTSTLVPTIESTATATATATATETPGP